MFYAADLGRFQDDVEQLIWELMHDHDVSHPEILRVVRDALTNVEHQIGEAYGR
jgi:hypothetical protein